MTLRGIHSLLCTRIKYKLSSDPKLLFSRQRTLHCLFDIEEELIGKRLLVLGRIHLPFQKLALELNLTIRRIFVSEALDPEFTVEDHYAEGYETQLTTFSKKAISGSWDFVVASQSSASFAIGHVAIAILQNCHTPIVTKDLILIADQS